MLIICIRKRSEWKIPKIKKTTLLRIVYRKKHGWQAWILAHIVHICYYWTSAYYLRCLKCRGKPMSHCNVHTFIVALLSLCLFLFQIIQDVDSWTCCLHEYVSLLLAQTGTDIHCDKIVVFYNTIIIVVLCYDLHTIQCGVALCLLMLDFYFGCGNICVVTPLHKQVHLWRFHYSLSKSY